MISKVFDELFIHYEQNVPIIILHLCLFTYDFENKETLIHSVYLEN